MPDGPDSVAATNKKLAKRFVEEVVNARNLEVLDELMHPGYVEQEPLPGQKAGRAGVAAWLGDYIAAFPDLRWQIEDQIAEEDRVATRVLATGTHQAEFLGVPATGHSMKFVVLLFQRMKEGRIVEGHTYRDSLAALRQLGQIHSPRD
jgi:steroid delta-isomerase-like uncharacterized protein